MLHKLALYKIHLFLVTIWLTALILIMADPLLLVIEYGAFAFLGLLGAIFANATGAGGGVIFVPFFNQLAFDSNTTVATSLAIQCCGMTAGALTWWAFYRNTQTRNQDWQEMNTALVFTVPFSIAGMLIAQYWQSKQGGVVDATQLHIGFGVFSIMLAFALFASVPLLKKQVFLQKLTVIDRLMLSMLSIVGGAITAYLSVGVGELIAVYLIIRRFNITFAIAVAVIISAFTVWSGITLHALLLESVYWPVVMFAGAGAIAGGMLAKHVVLYFSAQHLKLFFAAWILLLGIGTLPL